MFDSQFKEKYQVINSGSYKIEEAIIGTKFNSDFLKNVTYRPFDSRQMYYDPKLISRPAWKVMEHLLNGGNLSISLPRQVPQGEKPGCFISNCLQGHKSFSAYNINTIFPLYLHPRATNQTSIDQTTRTPNLNPTIVQQIAQKIGLQFTNEKEQDPATFAPIDLLDYIYAVLHSPTYRETYKEFLKIDFPRVPYPKDAASFWALVALGGELRQIHLLESATLEKSGKQYQYPADGDNIVRKLKYENGNVYINETQYFANVPPVAWSFYIGGYQPAQKWLKDRKDRELGFEDILHYQKIVVALVETDRIMGEVDKVGVV